SGVPPEGAPENPRVRVNRRWLLNKLKRRVRGFLLIGIGAIALWPLWAVPWVGSELQGVVLSLWAAYWLVVFTVAKTEHAWNWSDAPAPWYLRWAERAAAHRVARFWIWGWYAKLLRRVSGDLISPAAHL